MQTISTRFSSKKTNRLSVRKALLLLLFCIFAPGCTNNNAQSNQTNGSSPALELFAEYNISLAINSIHEMAAHAYKNLAAYTDVNLISDGRRSPGGLPSPQQAANAEHAIDPHTTNVDEKPLRICLPAFLRIAIMILILIIIV